MGYICAVQTSLHAAPPYIEMYRESPDFPRVFGQIVPLIPLMDSFLRKKLNGSPKNTLPYMSDNNFTFSVDKQIKS